MFISLHQRSYQHAATQHCLITLVSQPNLLSWGDQVGAWNISIPGGDLAPSVSCRGPGPGHGRMNQAHPGWDTRAPCSDISQQAKAATWRKWTGKRRKGKEKYLRSMASSTVRRLSPAGEQGGREKGTLEEPVFLCIRGYVSFLVKRQTDEFKNYSQTSDTSSQIPEWINQTLVFDSSPFYNCNSSWRRVRSSLCHEEMISKAGFTPFQALAVTGCLCIFNLKMRQC